MPLSSDSTNRSKRVIGVYVAGGTARFDWFELGELPATGRG